MSTLFQGLLLSDQKLLGPPVGCHRVLWSPLTLGPSFSVGPSLLAPQTMLPRSLPFQACPPGGGAPPHTGNPKASRCVLCAFSPSLSIRPTRRATTCEPARAVLGSHAPSPSRRHRIRRRPFQTRRVPSATSRQDTQEQPRQPSSPNPDCVVVRSPPSGSHPQVGRTPAPHSAARSRLTLRVRASQPHSH